MDREFFDTLMSSLPGATKSELEAIDALVSGLLSFKWPDENMRRFLDEGYVKCPRDWDLWWRSIVREVDHGRGSA